MRRKYHQPWVGNKSKEWAKRVGNMVVLGAGILYRGGVGFALAGQENIWGEKKTYNGVNGGW
jgi:hypothetical protein